MNKQTAIDFYLKICLWTFCCLGLAVFFNLLSTPVDNLFKDKRSNVIQLIQTINVAQSRYAETHQSNYAPDFYELVKEGYLEEKFAKQYPFIEDYVFIMQVTESKKEKPAFYAIRAEPYFEYRAWHFYFDSTLHAVKGTDKDRPATPNDESF